MPNLSKYLPLPRILLDVDVTSKKRLFEQIGLVFENENRIPRAQVFEALFAREKLCSTGLGLGVAIPHGRIKGLRDTLAVFIRCKTAIPFDAQDGVPVRLVLAMLVPSHATEQHLGMLSTLAQMFSDPSLREALLAAETAETVQHLLTEWTPYQAHATAHRSTTI
ncbi:MAG: PTS sugar transporter subunit IIA [Betaproteobacteria bacterium]|nr:PTS sugar transporter subunit IIA [Betaproteobacteria bacterium]